MRKYLLLIASLFALSSAGFSQATCMPNPIYTFLGVPGIWPNPQQGPLPDGTLNQSYTTTLTVMVPADTTIDLSQFGFPLGTITVAINSLTIDALTGLPSGLSTVCDQAGCVWAGGTNGCEKISGTPTQAGTFTVGVPVSINIDIPAIGPFSTPAVPVNYDLTILDPTSRNDGLAQELALTNAPNPFKGSTQIHFALPHAGEVTFQVYDLAGKVLHARTFNASAGEQAVDFDATALSGGLYMYAISFEGRRAVSKMTILQ